MAGRVFVVYLIGLVWQLPGTRAGEKRRELYEQDLINRALASVDLEPDPEPKGKAIEEIIIIRQPIIEATDPWPDFVNLFHVTTREHIIRQELLFQEGQVYDPERVQESARNLRAFPLLFSTALIVTAKGSSPKKVKIVVITKDLWSIRLNSQISYSGGALDYLQFTPSEQNFLGYNQQVSLQTLIESYTYTLGQVYYVPRLWGSRLSLLESFGLIMNHRTDEQEGLYGSLVFGRPLYSITSSWGFFMQGSFSSSIERDLVDGRLTSLSFTDGSRIWIIGNRRRAKSYKLSAQVVRSFGVEYKTNLTFGYALRSKQYKLPEDFPDIENDKIEAFGIPHSVSEAFRETFPPDDQAGEVFFNVSFFEATYRRFLNIQTFGLTEDVRLGPQASCFVYWANPAFGFAQQSVQLGLSTGYNLMLGKNILILQANLSGSYRLNHGIATINSGWVNRWGEVVLENISPSLWGLGRLFFRLQYIYTQYLLDRYAVPQLGGNNTLRGYPIGYAKGNRLLNVNLEFRSTPFVFKTLHFGFVLFYDGGDAYGYTQETDFEYHHSLGIGIRGLFPQFDRSTLRLDMGIPLGKDFQPKIDNWITISFAQAF